MRATRLRLSPVPGFSILAPSSKPMIEVVIGQKGRSLKQLNSNLLLNVLDKQILDKFR